MKHETTILKMLFAVTLAVSAGLFVSMLTAPRQQVILADPAQAGSNSTPVSVNLHHLACPLAPDGIICLRAG